VNGALEQEEAAAAENTLFGVPLRSPPFWVGEQDFVAHDSEGQSRDVIVSSEEKEGEAAAVVEEEQAAVVSQTAEKRIRAIIKQKLRGLLRKKMKF
jgi:hypothetical protein